MNCQQLLERLEQSNISVGVVDGRLKVLDPDKNLSEDLLASIRRNKDALIALVSDSAYLTKSDFPYASLSHDELAVAQRDYPQLGNLYVATPMQVSMLFDGMLDEVGASYTVQTHCALDIHNVDALKRAWRHVIERHDTLRTCFIGLDTGQVHQLVQSQVVLPMIELDWRGLDETEQARRLHELRSADKLRGFDFARAPLMRFHLVQLSSVRYDFLWSYHHALMDAWCNPVIFQEVLSCYAAYSRGETPRLTPVVPYENYIGWLFRQSREKAQAFWRNTLDAMTAPTPLMVDRLEADRSRRQSQTQRLRLSVPASRALAELVKTVHCTMNVALQAAWAYLLHRYSGDDSVVFGATVSGRPAHLPGVEQMMGLFINSLPVRVSFSDGLLLGDLLRQVHADAVARDEFGYLSLADIHKLVALPKGVALFDSLLVFQNAPGHADAAPSEAAALGPALDVSIELENANSAFKIGMVAYQTDALVVEMQYPGDVFADATITRLLGHLECVLVGMSESTPERPIASIGLLDEAERQQLLHDWQPAAAAHEDGRHFHELFEDCVRRNGTATAIVCAESRLSYAELNAQSNQLAHYLASKGIGSDSVVGLCVERSPEMLVGILGILKAGAAFLPLDPSLPPARLQHMLAITDCSFALVHSDLLQDLQLDGLRTFPLDDEVREALLRNHADADAAQPPQGLCADSLAYVIFTSGSTGLPKGVALTQRGLVNLAREQQDKFHIAASSNVLQFASIGFDAMVSEWATALSIGACLTIVTDEAKREPARFDAVVRGGAVTHATLPPRFVAELDATPNSAVETLVMAGEALEPAVARRAMAQFPRARVINAYGPTENTVCVSTFEIEHTAAPRILIGRPMRNVECYVVDRHGEPCPIGVDGELLVGGAGLARGYLKQDELTRQVFIAHPFRSEGRVYRTGDIGRWLPDGNLEFVGRVDSQVKLRGYRIELGEIESVLLQSAALHDAAVLARQDPGSEKRLVAYLVPAQSIADADATARAQVLARLVPDLKQLLLAKLPAYMVPEIYLLLEAMPLSNSGKVDRRALPSPQEDDLRKTGHVAPRNDTEAQLCTLWQDVLKLEQVGVDDNFFALGGDSIVSIQLVSRAKQRGLHFTVKQLFDQPTVAALALCLSAQAQVVETEQNAVDGALPLLPIQRRWFGQALPVPNHYNQAVLLETPHGFDVTALRALVAALYRRHDALRLRFHGGGAHATATHAAFAPRMLDETVVCHDLAVLDPAQRTVRSAELCDEAQASLDIEHGPLFKAVWFDHGGGEGRLLLAIHHLVVDGVSWRILLADLELGWTQLQRAQPVELGAKTSSLRQWGREIEAYAASDALAAERDYWLTQLLLPFAPIPLQPVPAQATGRVYAFQLDNAETAALLAECNKPYRTQVNELLLAALLKAYQEWSGSPTLCLQMEGHGREALFDHLDTSETLGWFTSVYPLMLSVDPAADTASLIKTVKEQYRRLPNRGFGYGVLREIARDADIVAAGARLDGQGIEFNYLGQFDATLNRQTQFRAARESAGAGSDPANPSHALLGFNGMVHDGRLGFSLSADPRCRDAQALCDAFERALKACIAHCRSAIGAYTPSDFPAAQLGQAELEVLQTRHPTMEKLYIAAPMQTGLLFHGLLDGSGASYTTQTWCDLVGRLDVAAFRRAWQFVVDRHDALRTCFVGLDSDQVHQLVLARADLPVLELDWRELAPVEQQRRLQEMREADKARGFDFGVAPLMRIQLVRLADDRYHFLWSHHHVLLDGWCGPIIFREVLACYRAYTENALPTFAPAVPYEHYIAWLCRQDRHKAIDFWRTHLAGVDTPTSLHPESGAGAGGAMRQQGRRLPGAIADKLDALAKRTQTTMNVVLQTAWSYLLHRYCGQQDVIFGATVSGRPAHLPGVEQMMGLFINTLPVRVQLDPAQPLGELLRQVHANNVARDEFAYLSLAQIQKLSALPTGSALFDTLLVFENYPADEETTQESGRELDVRREAAQTDEQTNYALTLLAEYRQTLSVNLQYRDGQFAEASVARLLDHLEQVLQGMAQGGAEQPVAALSLLGATELAQIAAWNATDGAYPDAVCMHALVEAQVARTPDAIALVSEGERLSYRALNARANRLAHRLIGEGVGPDTIVGLCAERSLELVVGLLAIVKAGGAYLPLDPSYPPARLAYLLQDSAATRVLAQASLCDTLAALTTQPVLTLAADPDPAWPDTNPVVAGLTNRHLAYVIYTSGSTGQPKGVLTEHRALVNRIDWMQATYALDASDTVLQKTPYSFDVSVWEFFWPLSTGATLVMARPEGHKDPDYLVETIRREGVTTLHYVPSMLAAMLAQGEWATCTGVRRVFCSGEALPLALVRAFYTTGTTSQLHNLYGPTEAAIDVSYWDCAGHASRSAIPIGRPIRNTQLHVLSATGQVQPVGVPGELHIGGIGLARGYLNKPELTAQTFIADPFGTDPQARLYKTGDLARWLPDGTIEYLGRIDHQVKLRGFRIELGEIENALGTVDAVREAVVVARAEAAGEQRLVAYLVPREATDSDEARQALITLCKQQLQTQLPAYMVPEQYVLLAAMPLSSNGKVDRKALPAPQDGDRQVAGYVAPRTATEEALCELWQSVLKREPIGVDDNFFALGGDSIVSIQVVSRAKQRGMHFSVRDLFERQTIAQLAPYVNAHGAVVETEQGEVEGPLALLPIQRRFFGQAMPVPNHYNQAVLLETPTGFDPGAQRALIEALYRRHDALRLRFRGTGAAVSAEHVPFDAAMLDASVVHHDLSAVLPGERAVQVEALCNAAQASLDIAHGPLCKAVWFDYGHGEGRLLLAIHHLAVDGVSWRILLTDLELAWAQLQRGEAITLAPKTSSLRQWGEAVQAYAQSGALAQERRYWLDQLALPVTPLPRTGNVRGEMQSFGFRLDAEATQLLLGESNKAYRTQVNELLLAALLKAFQQWSAGTTLCLQMEGHGREALFEQLDTNETVGWFTTVYPLLLSVEREADLGTLIKSVKEQYRGLPHRGFGYGVLSEIVRDGDIRAAGERLAGQGIEFNYLGQFDATINRETRFRAAAEPAGEAANADNPRPALISVNSMVHEGRLGVGIVADAACRDVAALSTAIEAALQSCIAHCQAANAEQDLHQQYAGVFDDSDNALETSGFEL